MLPFPLLTRRLRLRPFTQADAPALLEIVSHPSVSRIVPHIGQSEAEVRQFIADQAALPPFEPGKYFYLAIQRKDDLQVIGILTIHCGSHQQAELGWSLGVQHRGHGYATEAVRELVNYAFTALAQHRVQAVTTSANPASWKLMERLGMRKEACLREAEYRDGAWIDVLIYALLADEWLPWQPLHSEPPAP